MTSRRGFLVNSLSASLAVSLRASQSLAPARRGRHIFFFDHDSVSRITGALLVPAPVQKLGPVLRPDSPGDGRGVSTAMGGSIVSLEDKRLRIYYTGYTSAEPAQGICVAESSNGLLWEKPKLGQVVIGGESTNRLNIEGTPAGSYAVQPVVLQLSDGRLRLYFWFHSRSPRMIRYLCAESTDGLRWKIINFDRPCVIHPGEQGLGGFDAAPEAFQKAGSRDRGAFLALRRIRTNDATTVYELPGGGFEMFSVWPLPNPPGTGRRIDHDNAPGMLRVIHRRTSEDGLAWSDPELLIVPDERDPLDQQFYYLSQQRLDDLRIGFLGHYRVAEQTMDVEFTYSRDGHHWRRPLRGAWLPRGPAGAPDSEMVYMPVSLLEQGPHWLGIYTGTDYLHNRARGGGTATGLGVRIMRGRFAGLRAVDSMPARAHTCPFILNAPRIFVDAAIRGELRAELCDVFGQPFAGFSLTEAIPFSGDAEAQELRWKNAVPEDYLYDAVSLHLHWTDGAVYGLHFD